MAEHSEAPISLVRAIEERAFNAWPALQTLVMDGWVLRFADGYTKRANSLNAWQPTVPLDVILDDVATLYAARSLPFVVRLSPLAGDADDAALVRRGFALRDETVVMTAPLSQRHHGCRPNVVLASAPDAAWLDGFAGANDVPAARRSIHDRMVAVIPPPAAFARLELDGAPAAWGLAVSERGMVGLFDIVTARHAQRQGAGRQVVEALLDWATAAGASTASLQVVASNHPAISLYQSLGFTEAYRYHYRIARR